MNGGSKVVIIGRPNVGKSTLFNRLVGRRTALVHDAPGVTRDRREEPANLAGLEFTAVDTAGLEETLDDTIAGRAQAQTAHALAGADVAVLVIDGRAGVTALDRHFADWVRRQEVPVVLVANKCESRAGNDGLYEAYSLGLGEPIAFSAEHGVGVGALADALLPYVDKGAAAEEDAGADDEVSEGDGRVVRMAIVGRPNVGKSTLLNTLTGEDRQVTGPEPGITRDAIAVQWQFAGTDVALVDTAGLRRRARIDDTLEKMSGADTINAIRFAHVVVLVLDATLGLEKQDLSIARHVVEEGRGLVIAANKWDLVTDKTAAASALRDRLMTSLPQIRGVGVVRLSALTGAGLGRLMPAVLGAYKRWNQRVPTAALNDWLASATDRHPPPLGARGRRVRLRYATQPKARPPTVLIFTNRPQDLPESYMRYLENDFRTRFGLPGTPLRLVLRAGKNPYAKER